VLAALIATPVPLLPPHRVAEFLQGNFGLGWKAAYLLAAIGLQSVFYGTLGVVATFTLTPRPTARGRVLQILLTPIVVIGLSVAIRSLRAGYLPTWINAFVPAIACLVGVTLGLGLMYKRGRVALAVMTILTATALWALLGSNSAGLKNETQARLQAILAAGPHLPTGEARFGALLQTAFAALPDSAQETAMQQNRAAILAWGITAGHPRLARLAGLDPDSNLVRQAAAISQGTTLRGREDWTRHYALSAALAVLQHPLVSDAGGLMKEQLDALTHGSGFSFGDLAADRAGVRFATTATSSEQSAKAMQARIRNGYSLDDLFPATIEFPENLTVEQFRRDFGGVGSQRYRLELSRIEARLDSCAALSNVGN
jgi:hypothetical protein